MFNEHAYKYLSKTLFELHPEVQNFVPLSHFLDAVKVCVLKYKIRRITVNIKVNIEKKIAVLKVYYIISVFIVLNGILSCCI